MVAEKVDKKESGEKTTGETKKEETTEVKKDESAGSEAFKKPEPPAKKDSSSEEKKSESSADEALKPAEDATLILSAEEEAEIAAQTNEDSVKEQPSKETDSSKAPKQKKEPQKNVWVSNISRSTKAADLKKLFSEKFKVESAKIVTNGKSFFGYICLESAEMALKSVEDLNGSELSNKKITVSLTRPDLRSRAAAAENRRTRDEKRKESRVANGVKKSDDGKKGDDAKKTDTSGKDKAGEKKDGDGTEADKDTKESGDEKKKDDPEEEIQRLRRREQRNDRIIRDLKLDVKRLNTELQNNRRRLTEAQRRLDTERERKTTMRRDIETLEAQLKTERRKFSLELEQMEKKRKMDEIRYQDDRSILNKELEECRKLREYLQRKIDDLGMARSRSPSRRSGPGGGRGMPDRGSEKMTSRSRMHPDSRGGRSPPPPPKINNRRSRERSPGSYKGGKKPRLDEQSYGSNHFQGPQSFQGSAKPLMSHYPQSGSSGGPPRQSMYGNTAYPDPHRYGSSGYAPGPGAYGMGSSAPMMRPMGYPDVRGGGGPRKY